MKIKILFPLILILFFQAAAISSEITLENIEEPKIQYSKQVDKLQGSLFIENSSDAQIVLDKQQESDFKDIEMLWNATVENNSTIKFALQKLAIPEEQRRVHSSLLAKTTSALISGASMLPSFMGMHYAIQSASYATARIAHNFINKQNYDKLKEQPLTDTEALHLASLIEDLQNEIVVNYYAYKDSLNRLKNCKANLVLYNKNYHTAIKRSNKLEIAISSALWDEQVIEEYKLIQEVKKYQLILTRLSGKETVDKLELKQYNLATRNIKTGDLDFSKKQIDVSGGKK